MASAYPDKSKLPRSISFQSIFDNAPVGMALMGLDGRLLKVNQALCRILGYDEKYSLSSDFEAMIFADGSGGDTRPIQDLLAGNIPEFQREKQYVHRSGGSVWILMTFGLIRDNHGSPLHVIIQMPDISDYKKVEEEKETVVHGLNERVKELTALHYTARLLQDDEKPTPMLLQEAVTILLSACQHAESAAVRIFFDGVEYKSPNFIETGWTQAANFTTAGGSHGCVEITYPKNRPNQGKLPLLAEEKSLLESIAEMLQLYLERKEGKKRIDEITKELFARNKELWSLQQEMGRVEQRAARTRGNGTGLGLAVCQEIVKEHGGKIAISSEVEKGTSVKIFIPTDLASDRSLSNG